MVCWKNTKKRFFLNGIENKIKKEEERKSFKKGKTSWKKPCKYLLKKAAFKLPIAFNIHMN